MEKIDYELLEKLAAALAPADEIARCMGMTKTVLSKKIKADIGVSLLQYLKKELWKQRYELHLTEKELAKKSEKMAMFLDERLTAATEDERRPAAAEKRAPIRREYVKPGVTFDGGNGENAPG